MCVCVCVCSKMAKMAAGSIEHCSSLSELSIYLAYGMETEPIYLRLLRGLCRVYFTVIMDELDQLTDCLGDYFPHLDYVISNDDHLLEMARSLGGRWETVAQSLGFDSIDTESLVSSSPLDGEGKSYKMLRQWEKGAATELRTRG